MTDDLKVSALAACRRLLRPVVRMLLKHGVMHKEFVELSKELYVDIARTDYGLRGRPTNMSRVALLTGLGRKEIARLRKKLEQSEVDQSNAHQQDRIARVLTGWFQDSDYTDEQGTPLVIPLAGSAPSYEDLVKRYGGDVPAITIQRELTRSGAIRVDGDQRVTVLRRNYRLDTADPAALTRAGSVMEDIGRTVTHNLYHSPNELSRFEARASNVNVPASALAEYRNFIYGESQIFLEKVDAWLTAHEANPADKETLRLGIGMYWIQSASEGAQQ